jgi:hypothetical protein
MKKYKVLKEFRYDQDYGDVCDVHQYDMYKVGDELESDSFDGAALSILMSNGYIKEIEDDGVWSRGVKIDGKGCELKHHYSERKLVPYGVCEDDDDLELLAKYGKLFQDSIEAEQYAEHLRVENELINIGVRDHGGSTKWSSKYRFIASYNTNNFIPILVFKTTINGIYFESEDDRDSFTSSNKTLIDKYGSYFMGVEL